MHSLEDRTIEAAPEKNLAIIGGRLKALEIGMRATVEGIRSLAET